MDDSTRFNTISDMGAFLLHQQMFRHLSCLRHPERALKNYQSFHGRAAHMSEAAQSWQSSAGIPGWANLSKSAVEQSETKGEKLKQKLKQKKIVREQQECFNRMLEEQQQKSESRRQGDDKQQQKK